MIPADQSNQFMTAEEVSHFLRVPLSTVYGLASRGKLRAVKFGKHWRFIRQDIEGYLSGTRPAFIPPPENRDRRRSARVRVLIPAQLVLRNSESVPASIAGFIANMGETGALFVVPQDAPLDFQQKDGSVEIRFQDPMQAGAVTEIPGMMVRSARDDSGRRNYGIGFYGLDDTQKARLRTYVA